MVDATREEREAIKSFEPDTHLDALNPSAQYLQRAAKKIEAALTAAEAERDALKAENERLREALEPFAECADQLDATADRPAAPKGEWVNFWLLTDNLRRARAALTGDANG